MRFSFFGKIVLHSFVAFRYNSTISFMDHNIEMIALMDMRFSAFHSQINVLPFSYDKESITGKD